MNKECEMNESKKVSVIPVPAEGIGGVSDGYHTFNELYAHRTVLFAVICNTCRSLAAWKSMKHDDGSMYDDYFIVGINTPDGMATYHAELCYWNLFDVPELERAPKYDGHTPDDVLARLQSIVRTAVGRPPHMDELKATVPLMLSSDYKERFVAEYRQTKIRYERLKQFNTRIEAAHMSHKVREPEHDCSAELLRDQQRIMGEYLYKLEVRAAIEGIDLT